jgi:chromosomal replication initiation ATPase DnaA
MKMLINKEYDALMQCIISQCEDRILQATGKEVHLCILQEVLEENPILDKIGNELIRIWRIKPQYLIADTRKPEVVARKMIFSMLVKERDPKYVLGDIGRYLGGRDHTTVINWLRKGKEYLETKDPVFMSSYNQVKQLFRGNNI